MSMGLLFKAPALQTAQASAFALCLGFVLMAPADASADTLAWCERYDNQLSAKFESLPEKLRV